VDSQVDALGVHRRDPGVVDVVGVRGLSPISSNSMRSSGGVFAADVSAGKFQRSSIAINATSDLRSLRQSTQRR
jgi:hypothetical protein